MIVCPAGGMLVRIQPLLAADALPLSAVRRKTQIQQQRRRLPGVRWQINRQIHLQPGLVC